jgi:hypothetical protein
MASVVSHFLAKSHCPLSRLPSCAYILSFFLSPIDIDLDYSAGFKPFMEYAGSYALFNRLEDPARGLEYDNLRLIRAFEFGLDPTSSEAGFVLVHIAMVRHSGTLVTGAVDTLNGALAKDRAKFDEGLSTLLAALEDINTVMNSEPAARSTSRHTLTY